MYIQFATCDRHRALGYIRALRPSYEVHDTPENVGPILDLVAADVVRIQDPTMHPGGAVIDGNRRSECNKTDREIAEMFMRILRALPRKAEGK